MARAFFFLHLISISVFFPECSCGVPCHSLKERFFFAPYKRVRICAWRECHTLFSGSGAMGSLRISTNRTSFINVNCLSPERVLLQTSFPIATIFPHRNRMTTNAQRNCKREKRRKMLRERSERQTVMLIIRMKR